MAEPEQTAKTLLATQHLAAGRLEEAEKICREMLLESSEQAERRAALHLLAHVAVKRGDDRAAIEMLQWGVLEYPQDAAMWTDMGFLCARMGRLDEAIRALTRAVAIGPELVEAWVHLGDVRMMRGETPAAAEVYCRAVALRPDEPGVYARIGGRCEDAGKIDDLFAACLEILKVAPRAEAWFNIAFAAQLRGCVDVAIAGYRETLTLAPEHLVARNNLGAALRDTGEVDAAAECFRIAAEVQVDGVTCHSNLLYLMHFQPGVDPVQLRAEHERWNERHAWALLPSKRKLTHTRRTDRRLRIGYVSPDFCEHPVGRFLTQLFAHHDRKNFEIFAYSSVRDVDQITARLAASSEHWADVVELSDEMLAERIRDDDIDILVDLTMHMRGHRLLCFARKPAPIQVTYLGYCSTTGLKSIDYRLTDPYLDPFDGAQGGPPGETARDGWYVERSLRLPRTYWCYEPGIATSEVNALPALSRGYVTFASLNNFSKASPAALSAWAQILSVTKNSRLLLHAHRGAHRQRILDMFASRGVAAERIVFVDTVPLAEYFKLYQLVDIALDTFPYAGGTTTCDALWMGVPVVSLVGQPAISRSGLSILSNLALPELAVDSIEKYIARSTELAGDLQRLGELRTTLRPAMEDSALMDGAGFARDVEECYREMVISD
jgi:tetratricopeptide (TPR) repeat protein